MEREVGDHKRLVLVTQRDERRAPLFGQRVGLPEHAAVDRFGVLVQRVSRFGDDRRHVGPEPPSCEELLKLVPSEKSYIRVRGGLSSPCLEAGRRHHQARVRAAVANHRAEPVNDVPTHRLRPVFALDNQDVWGFGVVVGPNIHVDTSARQLDASAPLRRSHIRAGCARQPTPGPARRHERATVRTAYRRRRRPGTFSSRRAHRSRSRCC